MISVGVVQTVNSLSVEDNCELILSYLERFEKKRVDLVLFPECSLSGFTSQMRDCTMLVMKIYLEAIREWALRTGIVVVLPTALAVDDKIFNTGFWFCRETEELVQRFYKTGLTESEKNFFSLPEGDAYRIFKVKDYTFAVLMCFEAEHDPETYFSAKDHVDAILWPGYWGWTLENEWAAVSKDGKINSIFYNMKTWQVPLIQSNFAYNDLPGHKGAGPEGLSVVVDHDNQLRYRGPHLKTAGFIVTLDKVEGQTRVLQVRDINDRHLSLV